MPVLCRSAARPGGIFIARMVYGSYDSVDPGIRAAGNSDLPHGLHRECHRPLGVD
jgi:hypothetical protein